jgi:hypothetical protein
LEALCDFDGARKLKEAMKRRFCKQKFGEVALLTSHELSDD